jgi:hypothetical protein
MKKLVLATSVAVMLFSSAICAQTAPLSTQENLDTGIWWNGMENMGGQLVFSGQTDASRVLVELASNSEAGQKLSGGQLDELINGDEGYAVINLKELLNASLVAASDGDQQADEAAIVEAYAQAHSAYYLVCNRIDSVGSSMVSCDVATEPGSDGDLL